jgi:hypothetical protein
MTMNIRRLFVFFFLIFVGVAAGVGEDDGATTVSFTFTNPPYQRVIGIYEATLSGSIRGVTFPLPSPIPLLQYQNQYDTQFLGLYTQEFSFSGDAMSLMIGDGPMAKVILVPGDGEHHHYTIRNIKPSGIAISTATIVVGTGLLVAGEVLEDRSVMQIGYPLTVTGSVAFLIFALSPQYWVSAR